MCCTAFAGVGRPRLQGTRLKAFGSGGGVITRRCRSGILGALLLACAGGLRGQGGGQAAPLTALGHGRLIVWFVGAQAGPPQSNLNVVAALHDATPLTYQQQTAGSFGQNAAGFGEDAGSYGVDADSRSISVPSIPADRNATTATPNGIGYRQQEASTFGQNAASVGTAAGNYGMEGSALGQNAAGFGTQSSKYGTEASNVGEDSSNFAEEQSAAAPAEAGGAVQQTLSSPEADQIRVGLEQAYPDLRLRFVVVDPNHLKDLLVAARGTTEYPDVLVGTMPAAWWNGMDGEFGLTMLRPAAFYPNGVTNNPRDTEEVAILARAQHMEAARAFTLWMSEPYSGCPGCVQGGLSGKDAAVAAVAVKAVQRLVSGEPLGSEADPELAPGSSEGVQRMLATMGNTVSDDEGVRVQVEDASTNGSLAAVALRVVVSSSGVYGVAHPLVVLRETPDNRWRVLQLSLNMPQFEQATERRTLMETNPPSEAEQRGGVKGVVLTAPPDGQAVVQMPELVWDNRGGAGLQVVEWQRSVSGGWSEARLYMVEDRNPTLRTHVLAEFADGLGHYRWRVWSVGMHGEVKISAWRSFSIVH